jgi:hypothetical protein
VLRHCPRPIPLLASPSVPSFTLPSSIRQTRNPRIMGLVVVRAYGVGIVVRNKREGAVESGRRPAVSEQGRKSSQYCQGVRPELRFRDWRRVALPQMAPHFTTDRNAACRNVEHVVKRSLLLQVQDTGLTRGPADARTPIPFSHPAHGRRCPNVCNNASSTSTTPTWQFLLSTVISVRTTIRKGCLYHLGWTEGR